jgi:acyl-CoA thioesterase FadM
VIHFVYQLLSTEGRLLAEGETTHIVANAKMKPRKLPEKYMKVLSAAAGSGITEN